MDTSLISLGLRPFFTQQITVDEVEHCVVARVVQVQRSGVVVSDGDNEWSVALGGAWFRLPAEQRPTVGDWVLLEASRGTILRLLERKSVFQRVAAGDGVEIQLIAANIDTLFIVTSCNDEFNESRLERYLALAFEAGVDPVVVINKADLADDPEDFRQRALSVRADLAVELVSALDPATLRGLEAWVVSGSTVALVGSSGVGKSTLVNTLSGQALMQTSAVREQDAKGRHTTSFRALHRLPGGGLLLDVPGMRELKVAQLETSLSQVFGDIATIATQCRFADCRHDREPGCAVQEAIESGDIDPRRLVNFRKLLREDARHTTSLADQRHRQRQFGKQIKEILQHKRQRESDER